MIEFLHVPSNARLDVVRRMLGQVQGERVAIELPVGWTELDNLARMRLLQRQAQVQGVDIALITRHDATRRAAKQAGVPVFARPEEAGRGGWQMNPLNPPVDPRHPGLALPEPPPWRRGDLLAQAARPTQFKARMRRIAAEERYRRPTPGWVRWAGTLFLGGLLLALLGFFALYVLPAATITVVPGRATLNVTVPLVADANVDTGDVEAGVIPARLLETTIEEYGRIATTGSQQKPTEKSVGQVVFSNLGNAPVVIPANTEVTTSSGAPVAFRTVADAQLPGGVGQRVTVSIEAVEPGVGNNVRANTINTVSGPLRFRARVTNPNGTFGGGAQLVPVVTQVDQDNLLAQLRTKLEEKAYAALIEKVEEGEWLDPESVQVYVLAQVFDQFKDDEATELGLTLRVLVQGVAVNLVDMNQALLGSLQNDVPDRGRIIVDTFRTERLLGTTAVGRTTQFTSTASVDYVIPIDETVVKRDVAGLAPADAARLLQEKWRLTRAPEIYQDPAWLGRLPRFPNRIQVRIEYQGTLAADQP